VLIIRVRSFFVRSTV